MSRHRQAVLSHHRRSGSHHYNHHKPQHGGFDRNALPSPAVYYAANLNRLSRANGKGWAVAVCPFHGGGRERHPSFGVNLITGGFRCFACGVNGGDILAFHMHLHGVNFMTAARDLVAWGGGR